MWVRNFRESTWGFRSPKCGYAKTTWVLWGRYEAVYVYIMREELVLNSAVIWQIKCYKVHPSKINVTRRKIRVICSTYRIAHAIPFSILCVFSINTSNQNIFDWKCIFCSGYVMYIVFVNVFCFGVFVVFIIVNQETNKQRALDAYRNQTRSVILWNGHTHIPCEMPNGEEWGMPKQRSREKTVSRDRKPNWPEFLIGVKGSAFEIKEVGDIASPSEMKT
jgi:hypothetical protein